jgi:acetamidase/formamidase
MTSDVIVGPRIGCFGVAPPLGHAISIAASEPYGGNLDYPLFAPGPTAQFPIFVPGALLHLGDERASRGAGEIGDAGIGTSLEMELTVRVGKGQRISWSRGETANDIF